MDISRELAIKILKYLDENKNFLVGINLQKAADETGQDMTAQLDVNEIKNWVFYNSGAIMIESNADHKEALLVQVPKAAVKGQYIFLATVLLEEGAVYGNPQTFVVTVI